MLQSISHCVEGALGAYLDAVAGADLDASGKMAFQVAVVPSQRLCHLGRAPGAQTGRCNIFNGISLVVFETVINSRL